MTSRTSARHRAAPTRDHAGRNLRNAAVAAGSGLALLVATPAAVATPEDAPSPEVAADLAVAAGGTGADIAASGDVVFAAGSRAASHAAIARYTAEARAARLLTPTVVVPTEAEWTMASTPVAGEKPPPPPPPPPPPTPAPVVRQSAPAASTASRSTPRAPAAAPAPRPAAAPRVSGNAVLDIAYRYVGVPYVWGGSTPSGFDCSGFTQYVMAQLGVSLPRVSSAQRYAGTVVSAADARPGDLMWYPGHIGFYVGNGEYIGARQPGAPLAVGPIYNSNPTFIRLS